MDKEFRSREIVGVVIAFVLDVVLWFLFIFGAIIAGIITGLFVKEVQKGIRVCFIGGLLAVLVVTLIQFLSAGFQLEIVFKESILIIGLVNITVLVLGGFIGGALREQY